MDEAEIRLLEQTIATVKETQAELRHQLLEQRERIQELEKVKQMLTRLLPVEKQIDNPFKEKQHHE